MLQLDWLSYRTLSAIKVHVLWLEVVNKIVTISRFSEFLEHNVETLLS